MMTFATSPAPIAPPDWNLVWREMRQRRSDGRKKRPDWNSRAPSFARQTRASVYARNILELIKPQPHWRVLDVGCGPGTLAVPLAETVRTVTAIDPATAMIAILRDTCAGRGLANVEARELGWEDDWEEAGIGEHDVAIASRSLVVDDLQAAIIKLAGKARHRVYISSLVGDGPYDRRIFEAIGRELDRGPDFLCVYNLLNQMGILAEVSFLASGDNCRVYADLEEAVNGFGWMVADMTVEEKGRLRTYLRRHLVRSGDGWTLDYRHPVRWAVLSWRTGLTNDRLSAVSKQRTAEKR